MPRFIIKLHAKDKPVLVEIKKFLGPHEVVQPRGAIFFKKNNMGCTISWGGRVGRIYKCGPTMVILKVQSLKELERVINHLEKYPLITKKHADYVLFKKIFQIMKRKEHLTPEGLRKIVAFKAAMN